MQDNSSHSTASGSYAAHLRPTEGASQEIADSWRASRNRARDKWFNKKDSGKFDFAELEKRLSESGNHPVYNPDNYPLHMRKDEQQVPPPVQPQSAKPYVEPPSVESEMHVSRAVAHEQLLPEQPQTSAWDDDSSWSQRPVWESPAWENQVNFQPPSPARAATHTASSETVETFARILAELGMTSSDEDEK